MVIYKITNIITNKVYIGKTGGTLTERWWGHKAKSKDEKAISKLYRSMRKHGIENFKIEEIEKAYDINDLKLKEFKWIREYDSTNDEKGYNIQRGDENDNLVIHEDSKIRIVKGNKENKLNGKYKGNSSEMKTIYVGVYFIQCKKTWAYSISFNGKKVCKKRYETDYDAAIGRDIKLLELFEKEKAIEMMNFPENYEKYISKEIVEKERERKRKEKISTYKGVFYEENVNRWSSAIVHKQKKYKRGTFILERDAAEMADYIRVSNKIEGELNFPEINYSDSNYVPPKTQEEIQKSNRKYPDYLFEEKSRNGKISYRIRCKGKNIDRYFNNLDSALEFHKKTFV